MPISSLNIESADTTKEIETILLSELTDKILAELDLGWITSEKHQMRDLEVTLREIGAIVSQKHDHETSMIRFDILISALKVHGYSFGDMTLNPGFDGMRPDLNQISIESREILQNLATKATNAL